MKSICGSYKKVLVSLFCALTGATAATAHAGAFPSDGPVRLIVGFTPGGTIDSTARIVAEALSKRLKQSFVVENRSGANGMIAVRAVAQSKPDGYTLLISNSSSITVNPLMFKDAGYDPQKDLAPVGTVVTVPFVLLINPNNPRLAGVNDVKSLVEHARKNPDTVTYGSSGIGNLAHLAGAQLATLSNVSMRHVPYKGTVPVEMALLSGDIDFGFDTLTGVPYVKANKLKALAVSTAKRWVDLPDVPAVAELGYPGFDIGFWVGVFAPAGTPPAVIEQLNQALREAVADPQVKARLLIQGAPDPIGVDEFKQKITRELNQNAILLKAANVEAQ